MNKGIFTVGHSNQTLASFLEQLRTHSIDVVVDVRSYPISKYAQHFCIDQIKASLPLENFKYLFMGDQLGGMPRGQEFRDEEGNVSHAKIEKSSAFQAGIERVSIGVNKGFQIALMCGEENPSQCHRRLLLGRVLETKGLEVRHIRANGIIQMENDLKLSEIPEAEQLSIF